VVKVVRRRPDLVVATESHPCARPRYRTPLPSHWQCGRLVVLLILMTVVGAEPGWITPFAQPLLTL
jgi:hypothetical protein